MPPEIPCDATIAITTYNHARFLGSAIRSALDQSVAPCELIVVDDGSSDYPEREVARFPGVRLIRQANQGLAAARNTALNAASGRFILFLDADDRLLPNALRHNLARLAQDEEAAFSYGAYHSVDAASLRTTPAPFRPAPRDAYPAFLRRNLIGMHATVLYRREALAALGGFRVGLPACEDYDAYLRLSRRYPVLCGPEPLAEYWHHDGNMSRDAGLMLRSALAVLDAQRMEVEQQPRLRRAFEEGRAHWKRYYAGVWLRALRDRGIDGTLLRQGFSLLTAARLMLVRVALEEIRDRMARRIRRGRVRIVERR
jgi:GT2 family glycosyltransferase